MKKLILGLALAGLAAAPLSARWTLLPETMPVAVAKSSMKVVPGQGWNSWSFHPGKKSELWSYDGPVLNQIVNKATQFAKDRPWTTATLAGVVGVALLNTLRGKSGARR